MTGLYKAVPINSFWERLFTVCVLCVSDSTTARHLRNSGVTAASQQAWGKITVYTKQGFRYETSPSNIYA